MRFNQLLRSAAIPLLSAVLMTAPLVETAHAQFRASVFGAIAGGIIGGVIGGQSRGYGRQREVYRSQGRAPRGRDGEPRGGVTPAEETRALASLAPPSSKTQLAMLKSIFPAAALGAVGSLDDLREVGRTDQKDSDRDYAESLRTFITRFETEQKNQKSNSEGDVTLNAVERSVDKAIVDAKLKRFETFAGENWSAERLRVQVLSRATTEVATLFKGNNRGTVRMADLEGIISASAQSVARRLFETSELVAANSGSALFVKRLYQTHGDIVYTEHRDGIEKLLSRASASAISNLESAFRRDESGYALRYRAQRIVYDCLSANLSQITSSENGLASPEEVEQRVADTASQICAQWLTTQFMGADGKLKPQEPVPLRVIWSAIGPQDDPSMYTRASGALGSL